MKKKIAVDAFNMDVDEGEFIGLIGPNGAGKTTLVKMLTGIIAPTGGEIQVMGFYPNKLEKAFKHQYAVVMGQKSQLFFELTAEDTLRLLKKYIGFQKTSIGKIRTFLWSCFRCRSLWMYR